MSYNNVAGAFGGRCNGNVAGETGGRCNGNVAGETGRRFQCECREVAGAVGARIALRGPGCISGTGRCGDYTASFVERNGEFAEGYGNVDCDFIGGAGGRRDYGCCGQVSPAGNMQRRLRCDCESIF